MRRDTPTGRMDRFTAPRPGAPQAVRFPEISRSVLPGGLRIWSIQHTSIPVVSAVLVIRAGGALDPVDGAGLAGVTAHLADEGAGGRDAIELAEAFARLGTHLDVDVGPDMTSVGFTSLARFVGPALGLLADTVTRPHLRETDLKRVRELRMNRLRQLSRSPATPADRAFLAAVFGPHPYGRGVLGTTRSLDALKLDDVHAFHGATWRPDLATLIVVGRVEHDHIVETASNAFGHWAPARHPLPDVAPVAPMPAGAIRLVDRPGAPQSELRVGHTAPSRRAARYHALVTLNAVLGGEFSSRINRNLRERRGLTYGARSAFDLRRAGGSFIVQTSVQTDATAMAIAEILRECEAVREPGNIDPAELARAKGSLTRGYVRNFEAGDDLVRAAAQLVAYDLDDETFDRFVPAVGAITGDDLVDAARQCIRPADCALVVAGDAARCRGPLEALGRAVEITEPEF